jgi:hypothetical protein
VQVDHRPHPPAPNAKQVRKPARPNPMVIRNLAHAPFCARANKRRQPKAPDGSWLCIALDLRAAIFGPTRTWLRISFRPWRFSSDC